MSMQKLDISTLERAAQGRFLEKNQILCHPGNRFSKLKVELGRLKFELTIHLQ